MPRDLNERMEGFNNAQLNVAGTKFEKAIADLERATIGSNYNQRQRDILVILGAKHCAEVEDNKEVDKPILDEFEKSLSGHLGVTEKTIKDDIAKMGDLVHKPFIGDSRRDKTYWLTEEGAMKYRDYKQGKAAIILAAAAAIEDAGKKPKRWREFLLGVFPASALALAIFVADPAQSYEAGFAHYNPPMMSSAAGEVHFSENVAGVQYGDVRFDAWADVGQNVYMGHGGKPRSGLADISYLEAYKASNIRADFAVIYPMAGQDTVEHDWQKQVEINARLDAFGQKWTGNEYISGVTTARYDLAKTVGVNADNGINYVGAEDFKVFQIADRSSMFEEHLPKRNYKLR